MCHISHPIPLANIISTDRRWKRLSAVPHASVRPLLAFPCPFLPLFFHPVRHFFSPAPSLALSSVSPLQPGALPACLPLSPPCAFAGKRDSLLRQNVTQLLPAFRHSAPGANGGADSNGTRSARNAQSTRLSEYVQRRVQWVQSAQCCAVVDHGECKWGRNVGSATFHFASVKHFSAVSQWLMEGSRDGVCSFFLCNLSSLTPSFFLSFPSFTLSYLVAADDRSAPFTTGDSVKDGHSPLSALLHFSCLPSRLAGIVLVDTGSFCLVSRSPHRPQLAELTARLNV